MSLHKLHKITCGIFSIVNIIKNNRENFPKENRKMCILFCEMMTLINALISVIISQNYNDVD